MWNRFHTFLNGSRQFFFSHKAHNILFCAPLSMDGDTASGVSAVRRGFRSTLVQAVLFTAIAGGLLFVPPASAQEPASARFLNFVRKEAQRLRAADLPPAEIVQWNAERHELRARLLNAWGGFPERPCDLEAKTLGVLRRDGYRIEKLVFQTLPGIWMTANAYVPIGEDNRPQTHGSRKADHAEKDGQRRPAVLCVHGHWSRAKQDPVVQARCIGLAKLGFFVLCVDAFGAGERGIGKALGEYHGEMTGAMLLTIGRPLSGIQVYENMRAVDYLQSRPEVDPQRIGITGASGGGNQSMYAGAFDERFRCVVPTCSVGNYQAYLGAACCMCEVVPGALTFTEEGNVLALAADRGLMVTSATRDAFQFSVEQARISMNRVREIASLSSPGAANAVRHTVIESPHDYNQEMREAMYGWMTLHLKQEGDGSPIPEPPIQTEEPEEIRCFPGDSRPDDFVTLPKFVADEARRLLAARHDQEDVQILKSLESATTSEEKRAIMDASSLTCQSVLRTPRSPSPLRLQAIADAEKRTVRLSFHAEEGLEIFALCDPVNSNVPSQRTAILVDIEAGAEKSFQSDRAEQLRKNGWTVVAPELRATGEFAVPTDRIGHAPDHNSAEWSLWIGRPLLGQWTWDVRRTLDAVAEYHGSLPKEVRIVGHGPSGFIALSSAALDSRISQTRVENCLATLVSDSPHRGQRLGFMVPGILRDVGDVPHLAAMIAPRRLEIVGGVDGNGRPLAAEELTRHYSFTAQVFSALSSSESLSIETLPTASGLDQQ